MSGLSIPQNSAPTEPSLNDLLNLLKKEIFLDLNCHHLATVQSFDPDAQTITATINYSKTVFTLNQDTQLYVATQVSYPQLVDVPVIAISYLTHPIEPGDQCLILFNDRSIDNWFQSSTVGPVPVARYHSFADGLALVGLNNIPNAIANWDNTRATLRNKAGTTGVGVGDTQVKIFNEMNGSLGPNFTAFFMALNTFMQSCTGSSTDPVLAAAASAFAVALEIPVAPSSQGPVENIEGILE